MKNPTIVNIIKDRFAEKKIKPEYLLQLDKVCKLEDSFTKEFSKVLNHIQEDCSADWLYPQLGIDRSSVLRILNGKIAPSLSSFFKYYYLYKKRYLILIFGFL